MGASDMVLLALSGGSALLGDIAAPDDKPVEQSKPTVDEVREAESRMSSMF